MPKMKTHKGTAKRIRLTASGKPMHRRSGKNHLLEHKSKRRKSRLNRSVVLSDSDRHRIKRLLPHR
jgi:large subunit ribosomal protein L35